ncbi:tRNA selenocysteine 1-associated protein 1-like isoform X2 [Macrosteles quadrilineatus]|uniref:tRNA selenocysteine 1-associated protein 1-like isoform X2 n=1 Tax=Macrosteles quadrilineatus TaxID=74068 RepID=UPI0023E0A11E|nr:tRNA selenocysteine 1-associated protein 1-like isoform X2 [Macrosteles quadrilineatus]XP_054278616.1 tRNA selenocysteine 1-associated protein 1-like isoform X2 [Macrosteles quadrilineatus]
MSSNIVHCQLWMGGVEPYMNEQFIMSAFQRMGEKPLSVKVMRNKITGELCGYCFVHFQNDDEAIKAMHKLNGKFIPNSNPPSRFRLNNATSSGKMNVNMFSLWVGDLSQDVDDYQLYKAFASRYQSVRAAKVVMDSTGHKKGYGFVQFTNLEEQKHALTNMNGFKGLGNKPIKTSTAVPKSYKYPGSATQDYSQYYDNHNYWQSYSSWQSYYGGSSPGSHTVHSSIQQVPLESQTQVQDDLELIDHNTTTDVEAWNRELMERDYNLWDAMESSKWLPLETYC